MLATKKVYVRTEQTLSVLGTAHDALRLMVDTYESRKAMASWRRPPGRPCNVWLNKVQEDANALLQLSTLWRSEIARGH